jgi:hypothetical protein
MHWALPAVRDVRRAAEALPRLFGDSAAINIPWAARRKEFATDEHR